MDVNTSPAFGATVDESSSRSLTRGKIKTITEIADIAERLRSENKTVALCHGVFDLLHLGHIRYLEAARREADVLVVTLTADAFVNKGPGRPIFPEHMRAEMLAALNVVDWVGINHDVSAEPVLNTIKPNVYVKGSDYENQEDDITGKIQDEREAVEKHGGQIVFTKDITFSSSSLINKYLNVYDPPLRDLLDDMRQNDSLNKLLDLIERVRDYKVVMIGDAIVDEYKYVTALGKSPKENMIATLFKNREVFAGGVFAAANHVANFCKHVEVITLLGTDKSSEGVIRQSLKPNVSLVPLYVKGRTTTRKQRFVEAGHIRKMFEVYFMDDSPIEPSHRDAVNALVADRAGDADVVIVTDFGHGMIDSSTIKVLEAHSKFLAVNAQSNSANHGFNLITRYSRADFICIDAPEARLAVSDKYSDIAVIIQERLTRQIDCSNIIVTHGSHGCYTYSRGHELHRIPAFTNVVVDTVGAGDAFFSVTAPLLAVGGAIEQVAFVGNAAGAMKVGIVGHRSSVEKVPLIKFLTALLK